MKPRTRIGVLCTRKCDSHKELNTKWYNPNTGEREEYTLESALIWALHITKHNDMWDYEVIEYSVISP